MIILVSIFRLREGVLLKGYLFQGAVLVQLESACLPQGRRASFGSSGLFSEPLLTPLRNASCLGTGTLKGPPQPNWCQLLLATVYLLLFDYIIFLNFVLLLAEITRTTDLNPLC